MHDAEKYINELDLSVITRNLVLKQGWLESEVLEAIKLYKNFLFLHLKYPNEILAPSEDIDEVWHDHILNTKKYRLDCEKIFGRYLDHQPNFDMEDTSSNISFARTQELHLKEFGYPIVGVRFTKFCRLMRRLLGDK